MGIIKVLQIINLIIRVYWNKFLKYGAHGLGDYSEYVNVDWLQSLKQLIINVSYQILVASLTLMALF